MTTLESLMKNMAEKGNNISARTSLSMHLGPYQEAVEKALVEIREQQIMRRIWSHDHTVWKSDPKEITNRLGWLHVVESMAENIDRLKTFSEAVWADGFTHALLMGMGGSSLAPEVFQKTFGREKAKERGLNLAVLDSTDPDAILSLAERLDPKKTLFIVSTKSGGTVETLSFFKFFYNHVCKQLDTDRTEEHFVAITDPASKLETLARQYRFRACFLNDPDIGGRYSALSYFGLVPAALVGVDLERLLGRALNTAFSFKSTEDASKEDSDATRLGAAMGELAKAGRDKVTLITSPAISSLGDWIEQLIAESTGKEGKGILPVVGETTGKPDVYGKDRLFVYLRLAHDETHDSAVHALESAEQPLIRVHLEDMYDLGGQFFLWELATAVAGYCLGINPFDQPNVEAAKVLAREMVATYKEEGKIPELEPVLQADGISVYGDLKADRPGKALTLFLDQKTGGEYVAIQAYVQPTSDTDQKLVELREKIRNRTKLATTIGYGPRFLHSTGQLHKGDAGHGLFIQFTSDARRDVQIPDEAGSTESSISFGLLKMTQALGDRQALLNAGRRVIRFHLGSDVLGGFKKLIGDLT